MDVFKAVVGWAGIFSYDTTHHNSDNSNILYIYIYYSNVLIFKFIILRKLVLTQGLNLLVITI